MGGRLAAVGVSLQRNRRANDCKVFPKDDQPGQRKQDIVPYVSHRILLEK